MMLFAVVLVTLQCLSQATFPLAYYDSYGPNQLFNQQGQSVKTVSGKDALYGVDQDYCAGICNWMKSKCDCCNSFSYQPSSLTCYLKKRSDGASDALSYNQDGWQSYKFWDLSDGYNGGLPEYAIAFATSAPVGYFYTKSFVSKGPNQVATFQGDTVTQASGVSAKQCAEMCLEQTCDGFSYHPTQEGGKCFLKSNSYIGKYYTEYNSEGWTFYWLEEGVDKCYCTCASEYVCITCASDGTCADY